MNVFGPGSDKIYVLSEKGDSARPCKKYHKFQVPYEIFQIESLLT